VSAPQFVWVVTVTDQDGYLNLLGAGADEAARRHRRRGGA